MADSTDAPTAPLVTPRPGPRPKGGPMEDEEFRVLVGGLIESARNYVDTELSPDRAKATKYYDGKPFGNEEEGRSQVVSTDVRDGIIAVLPPILRGAFGPERVVEFVPNNPATAEQAEQATDYVQHVFLEENAGFMRSLDVLKDGLQKKLGIFKWFWDETYTTCSYKQSGVTQADVELLGVQDGVEITVVTPDEPEVDAQGQPMPATLTVEYTKREKDGRPRVLAVPPEEFIFNREARDKDTAAIIGHRTQKTRGELLALGVSEKLIDEHGTPDTSLQSNPEELERNPGTTGIIGAPVDAGKANELIGYTEAYAPIDFDGDGIAELRRIVAIGSGNYPVSNDPATEIPFAIFCPDPEAHAMIGGSWFDRLGDIQLAKSSVMRAMLDSLAASIFPRVVYVNGKVNLADVLNTAIGAPIRATQSVADVAPFKQDFVGREAFPVLDYFDATTERRTGQARGAASMDIDALQSTEKAAAKAAVTASQAQQEMLLRIFAEMTLKPLFKGIYGLLVKHQPRERVIRLRGSWATIDPRTWDADLDATVTVALGSGLIEEKIAALQAIVEEMKFIFATFGLQNPIVNLKQYRDALAEIAALRGRKDATRYFLPVDLQALAAQQAQQAQQPPPPSPEMMLAQSKIQLEQQKAAARQQLEEATAQANIQLEQARAERQHQIEIDKAQREQMFKQADLAMAREQAYMTADIERERLAADIELRRLEMTLKYGAQVSEQQVDAEIEHTRTIMDAHVAAHATETDAETQRYGIDNQPAAPAESA